MDKRQSTAPVYQATPPRTDLIASLAEFTAADLARAGGKGANLGELVRAGFPVPPGFVVTTAAYDRFVAQNDLHEIITRALREEPHNGTAIRDAFEHAPIPDDIERAIHAAYRRLGTEAVAVRSSATAEDLPGAAFAGQQETFLNVFEAELSGAVRRCWASLWNDRAIAYRERLGVDEETVKLAVVVQKMVLAEFAGVMFTANPVTGARNQVIVDASPGLGEAVVSGLVTPDHYLLRKRAWGWEIVERLAGRREVTIRARSGGGTERFPSKAAETGGGSAAGANKSTPDQTLRRLARLGARIQRHFASPQDIEWAWSDGELYILQARPMTALPKAQPQVGKSMQMLAPLFAEMFPIRPYPLDQTTWVPAISTAAVEPLFGLIGIKAPPIGQLFDQEDGVVIRFSGKAALRPTQAILLAPVRLLRLALRYDCTGFRQDPRISLARARSQQLQTLDLQPLSWQDLLATVRAAVALALPLAGQPRHDYYPRALLAAGLLRLLLGILRQGNLFGSLLSGVESQTLEANRALEALAALVRSNANLTDIFASHAPGEIGAALEAQPAGRAFLTEFATFLERYGHREDVLSTVLQPTWRDDPELVLGMIKGFALTTTRPVSERPAWRAAQEQVLQRALMRLPPARSGFLGLVHAARCLWQVREDTHYDATRIMPILRRTFLELGRRLAAVGILHDPKEVFHLQFSELARIRQWPPSPQLADELRAAVRQRQARRVELESTPVIDPRLFAQTTAAGEALLRGTSGSPGVADGPVCVVHDASEFGKLRAGQVLVCPFTNPAWTLLFERAIAVVVDSAGVGSHAAIVAREYGIPAVMGTVLGTQKLQDGQWVRVEGSRGIVLSSQAPALAR